MSLILRDIPASFLGFSVPSIPRFSLTAPATFRRATHCQAFSWGTPPSAVGQNMTVGSNLEIRASRAPVLVRGESKYIASNSWNGTSRRARAEPRQVRSAFSWQDSDRSLRRLLPFVQYPKSTRLSSPRAREKVEKGGDEWQLSRAVRALVERHDAGESARAQAPPGESPFETSQTLRSERLRQPPRPPVRWSASLEEELTSLREDVLNNRGRFLQGARLRKRLHTVAL